MSLLRIEAVPAPRPADPRGVLHADVHGVALEFSCADEAVLAELRRDFAYFVGAPARRSDVRVRLWPVPPPPVWGPAWLRWKGCRARGLGGVRTLEYPGAAAAYDFAAEEGQVWTRDSQLARELAFLMAHSALGRLLDARGLHRVHGLGVVRRGAAGLVLLPPGGGKTSLFLELLSRPELSFLSDEIPLLDRQGRLHPFPQRPGLRGDDPRVPAPFKRLVERRVHPDKIAIDVEYYRARVAGAAPLRWIVVGERSGASAPRLSRCSKARAWSALAGAAVVGAGVPQVLELLLPAPPRFAGSGALARALASRALAARAALRGAETLVLSMSSDPARDARALTELLEGGRG